MMKIKNNLEVKAFQKILDNDTSVKAFCELCGIEVITFFNICEGKYIPNLEIALKMADVLNCHVDDIFALAD